MPVYNSEKYILHAVDSILKQTYDNFEFIIIDDASIDNSVKLLNQIEDKRIKLYVNKSHKGISTSLNRGLQHCEGEYIARMDSDDLCSPHRFTKQIEFMDSHPEITISGTNIALIDAGGNLINEHKYRCEDIDIKTDLFFGMTPLAHSSIMIRNSFVNRNNVYYDNDAIYAEDYELYCRYHRDCIFSNIPETLVFYRKHIHSVSINYNEQQRLSARQVLREHLNNIGLECNETQFEAHCSLYLPMLADTVSRAYIEKWIDHLEQFNKEKKLFEADYFIYNLQKWRIALKRNEEK